MADESMLRILAAQAEAIWPQEAPLLSRLPLPQAPKMLDLACGPGEISERLLSLFPEAQLVGIDVEPEHVARAQERCGGDRASFEVGDAYAIAYPDDEFDLALCRHLLQAVPQPERIVAELARVVRPGGRLHIVAEDYSMMFFHPLNVDNDDFWNRGPITFGERSGTDMRSGRKLYTMLYDLGLDEIRADYIIVDTTRVDRGAFARIWRGWRDGYADVLAARSRLSKAEAKLAFDEMIAAIESPRGYGVWFLPVFSAQIPCS